MKNYLHYPYYLLLFFIFWQLSACHNPSSTTKNLSNNDLEVEKLNRDTSNTVTNLKAVEQEPSISFPVNFTRADIVQKLKKKKANQPTFVIHILVPLCDNQYQGIVAVSKNLGNGQNPISNLYWGALYGVKTHFKKSKKWQLVKQIAQPSNDILERVVFEYQNKKNNSSASKIFLVADAYDGQKMRGCLNDFFAALAGAKNDSITLKNESISIYSKADLLVFNGHNGLMDVEDIVVPSNINGQTKDAMMLACISGSYFKPHLQKTGGYPLLTTTNLLAPEAYILEAAFEDWIALKDGAAIRESAAKAYHKYQKCGINGARRLFATGWAE